MPVCLQPEMLTTKELQEASLSRGGPGKGSAEELAKHYQANDQGIII